MALFNRPFVVPAFVLWSQQYIVRALEVYSGASLIVRDFKVKTIRSQTGNDSGHMEFVPFTRDVEVEAIVGLSSRRVTATLSLIKHRSYEDWCLGKPFFMYVGRFNEPSDLAEVYRVFGSGGSYVSVQQMRGNELLCVRGTSVLERTVIDPKHDQPPLG